MEVNNSYVTSNEEIGLEVTPGHSKAAHGVSVSFHEVVYDVDIKAGTTPCSKSIPKTILKSISGVMEPGLTAIMGPTGSGKTSLLDILAGRKDPSGIKSGEILFNGKHVKESAIRFTTGYVVQDDIILGTLTVRENLLFSANLRLSNTKFSEADRAKKVDKLIEDLGLLSCADTKVGNEFIRGISGGERKRVAIGMELVIDPPVLFLDEPTTGLDSFTAASIIRLMKNLGKAGRTIILSIHQPRYSIFSMFDHLMILSRGKMVYNGTSSKIVDYFASIGYACPQYDNPADFLLDVVNGQGESSLALTSGRESTNDSKDLEDNLEEATDELEQKKIQTAENLSSLYTNSQLAEVERAKLKEVESRVNEYDVTFDEKITHANGFAYQLRYLLNRTSVDIIRYPLSFIGPIIMNIVVALIVGTIFFQLDYGENGIQDRSGAIFFVVTFHVMMNVAALDIFLSKKTLFVHEKAGGYYRTAAYFLSRMFADIVALRWAPLLFLSVIIYFMIGFQIDAGKFFFFLLTLALVASTATNMAFAISSTFNTFSTAIMGMMAISLLMILFAGFLTNINSVLSWLEWIKWFSIFRYGINALTINEMVGLVFIGNSSYPGFDPNSAEPCISTISSMPIPGCVTGEAYLERQSIPYDDWGKWQNIFALVCMTFGFAIIALIKLRLMSIYK